MTFQAQQKNPKNGRPLTGLPVFSLPRRGTPSGGRTFLLVQKDPEERARQREGLFTKPLFPLESHPPKFVFPPRLALPCALPRSARPAQGCAAGNVEGWPAWRIGLWIREKRPYLPFLASLRISLRRTPLSYRQKRQIPGATGVGVSLSALFSFVLVVFGKK